MTVDFPQSKGRGFVNGYEIVIQRYEVKLASLRAAHVEWAARRFAPSALSQKNDQVRFGADRAPPRAPRPFRQAEIAAL